MEENKPFISDEENENALLETVQALLSEKKSPSRANVGSFLNSLTQSLQKIQLSGIPAVSERRETDSQIVLTITIPK